MITSLEALYHQRMMDYFHNPSYKDSDLKPYLHKNNNSQQKNLVVLRNPMCGDVLCFYCKQDKKMIWYGEGCMICLASAEALADIINTTQHTKKKEICDQISSFFVLENSNQSSLPEKFIPFQSVKEVKSRVNCVMLAVNAVQKLLQET